MPSQHNPLDPIENNPAPKVTPSEAIYGFAGWLSTRQETISVGSIYHPGELATLVADYCKAQGFEKPRDFIYPGNLNTMQKAESEKATDTLQQAALHYSPSPARKAK